MKRSGDAGDQRNWKDEPMEKKKRYPQELRERAVRLTLEEEGQYASRWAAITSIAQKPGCGAESLRKWIDKHEKDSGVKPGVTTIDMERMKNLERENRELKRANEILRKASAFFAQAEFDRRPGNW
jgi:transposase